MRGLHILLAEDQSHLLTFLRTFPEPFYEVVGAAQDTPTLLTAARVLKPDILIIDIDVPSLNGIETIRQVRGIVPNCCVILQTCCAEPESIAEAYDAGVSAYFIKGSSSSDLMLTMRALIGQPRRIRKWKNIPGIEHPHYCDHMSTA